ncbi:MAG: kinase/pyrophosphorylase [Atopobiaceae bacterium]|nr:kinase/pyrophosphorylase [Atopobiaceae bacterium]
MSETDRIEDDELDIEPDAKPIIHVISDSLGDTASDVVAAAASQFDDGAVRIARLTKVSTVERVRRYFDVNAEPGVPKAVFHTIVDPDLRAEIRGELDSRGIPSIDLIGPAISVISMLTGDEPKNIAGAIHDFNDRTYKRSDAMQFFVSHDDTHNPQDLPEADVIIMGLSRTAKTPIATYLAFMGLKVACISLRPDRALPDEVFSCDPSTVFALTSTTDKLIELRERRLHDDPDLPYNYADRGRIVGEQMLSEEAMEAVGCTVIETGDKAVEDIAKEILEHLAII